MWVGHDLAYLSHHGRQLLGRVSHVVDALLTGQLVVVRVRYEDAMFLVGSSVVRNGKLSGVCQNWYTTRWHVFPTLVNTGYYHPQKVVNTRLPGKNSLKG